MKSIKKFFKKEEEIINPFYTVFGRKKISIPKLLEILQKNGYRKIAEWKFIKVQGDIKKEVSIGDMKVFLYEYIKKNFHSEYSFYFTNQQSIGRCFVRNLKSL